MSLTATEPISRHWTIDDDAVAVQVPPSAQRLHGPATVVPTIAGVVDQLGRLEPHAIDEPIRSLMAAAAAEVASAAGLQWRHDDDAPTAPLVRLLTKAAARTPAAGGPHTTALFERLSASVGVASTGV